MKTTISSIQAVNWCNDHIRLLDQRLLPKEEVYLDIYEVSSLANAIRNMVVRGAPAIGITAAYGSVLAARDCYRSNPQSWRKAVEQQLTILEAARPTAVNLSWAINTMRKIMDNITHEDPTSILLNAAQNIHDRDVTDNKIMGEFGATLINHNAAILTHCNAGSLATGGYGTALGVIRSAYFAGKIKQVYADETRPWLQGARLTAWELIRDGIPVTIITDNAAAHLMNTQAIQWIIVGADRIAANGDTANKIGTYSLAVAAHYHGINFMVVAPTSTFDTKIKHGQAIPIEIRAADEVITIADTNIAPLGVQAWNPAFDITPAELISAIVTERGIIIKPNTEKIAKLLSDID